MHGVAAWRHGVAESGSMVAAWLQRAAAHALPRRRPQLHWPAAPAALLLAVCLVVARDLVGALHVVTPDELPALEKGAQREVL